MRSLPGDTSASIASAAASCRWPWALQLGLLAEATVAVVLSQQLGSDLVGLARAHARRLRDDRSRCPRRVSPQSIPDDRVWRSVLGRDTPPRIDRWHADAIASVAGPEPTESTEAVFNSLRRDGASDDEIALLTAAAHELTRLDDLFRPYLPAFVGDQLRRDASVARLGGEERIVSVLFADLAGFTAFSEEHRPAEVIAMLNTYWAAVVPVIEGAGGVVDSFAGDGVLAVFNASGGVPDHAERAVRAGLSIIERARDVARANPGWPMFRVGVNTGRAVVGNVGVEGRRSFSVIGDTTNVAARLLVAAEPGQLVASATTWAALDGRGDGVALGAIALKGKRDPVEAWAVTGA